LPIIIAAKGFSIYRKLMNWDDVKILLTIARAGGLSRAAKVLGVSVSTVHRRAIELEQSLKTTLFVRGNDGYTLTDAGRINFAIAEKAEEQLIAMERGNPLTNTSVLRIALPELLGQQLILPRLASCQVEHPNLQLEISTTAVPVEFNRREADIAVRLVRPETGRYLVRRIGKLKFGLFASPEYLSNAPELKSNDDLAAHRLIGWDRNLQFIFLAQRLREFSEGVAPSSSFDSLQAQLLAAQAGYGIALLPVYSAGETDLIQVLNDTTTLEQDIWLLRHRDTSENPTAEVVCNTIVEAIRMHRHLL